MHYLDLPYIYSTEGKIKEPNLLAEAGQGLLGTFTYLSTPSVSNKSLQVLGYHTLVVTWVA